MIWICWIKSPTVTATKEISHILNDSDERFQIFLHFVSEIKTHETICVRIKKKKSNFDATFIDDTIKESARIEKMKMPTWMKDG